MTNAAAVTLDEVDLWDLAHFARGPQGVRSNFVGGLKHLRVAVSR